jgi:hypothetical protein
MASEDATSHVTQLQENVTDLEKNLASERWFIATVVHEFYSCEFRTNCFRYNPGNKLNRILKIWRKWSLLTTNMSKGKRYSLNLHFFETHVAVNLKLNCSYICSDCFTSLTLILSYMPTVIFALLMHAGPWEQHESLQGSV